MRVHPIPRKRTFAAAPGRQKKLRRLPHIFSKVLELPLSADADVAVHDSPQGLRFTAPAADDVVWADAWAHAIEIHPGVTKVVIRHGGADPEAEGLAELELDRWRFRLPPCTRPRLATAGYANGELVVTVPKSEGLDEEEGELDGGDAIGGGIGRPVMVQ